MAFIVYYDINLQQLSLVHILGFIEHCAASGLSYKSINNYVSGLRSMFHKHKLPVQLLYERDVKLMLFSCSKNIRLAPRSKGIFTIPQLTAIIHHCGILQYPSVYRAIFLTAFHGFFRLSNLVPTSKAAFDLTRHLARGDIVRGDPGFHVIVKWTKTLQTSNHITTVPLPYVHNSSLCPVKALLTMFSEYPLHNSNLPMFSIITGDTVVVVTQSQVRQGLAKILGILQLSARTYGFHTFRRSAASLAFQLQVPIQEIQSHGTWASNSV